MSAKPIIIPDPKLDDEPIAHLEHELIVSFLREKGHTLESIKELPETEAHQIMVEASRYASARLAELEARSRFVDTLHEAGKSVES
jgi:hypothetical protein